MGDAPAMQAMKETGIVKMSLHGPRGDLNGVLLDNGTIVHLPPGEAARLADATKPGQPVAVRGEGLVGPAGRVLGARAFGPSMDRLVQLEVPQPPKAGPGAPPAPKPGAS